MRDHARAIFTAGVRAVEPAAAVKRFCRSDAGRLLVDGRTYDLDRFENVFVIGAGKASAPMAAAVEEILGSRISGGRVNVKYGHGLPLHRVGLTEAGHPVPDLAGQTGAEEILKLAESAGPDDLILCLLSGGGSALLPCPAPGLTLKDKQAAIHVLLSCGASIDEINAIRKHTSRIKGGRLARAAFPAETITLMLSDVVGDELSVIASGPTVPDASRFGTCLAIIEKYQIASDLPGTILSHLEEGAAGRIEETPEAGDPVFDKARNIIIGTNMDAIQAAGEKARHLGYNTMILSSMIEGETRHVARVHTAIAREICKTQNPVAPPACILSGGETTVTLAGKGKGGRNQEFALQAAIDIAGTEPITILSGGTDGNDGPTDAAGAVADHRTLQRAGAAGLDANEFLANNDSYHFFQELGDLLMTGPTNTNVMDLRILLVG
jgi:hydroxypyruvate reductase